MKPDPELQELVAKLKEFLAYCDDTSLPRPPAPGTNPYRLKNRRLHEEL